MKTGDRAVCVGSRGYDFTTGKEYEIVQYDPPYRAEGDWFTWPAYVAVVDNSGKLVHCHAHRFKVEEATHEQ